MSELDGRYFTLAHKLGSCLPILHEHSRREELLQVLIDAGEAAWDRGAHEVCSIELCVSLLILAILDGHQILRERAHPVSQGSLG